MEVCVVEDMASAMVWRSGVSVGEILGGWASSHRSWRVGWLGMQRLVDLIADRDSIRNGRFREPRLTL